MFKRAVQRWIKEAINSMEEHITPHPPQTTAEDMLQRMSHSIAMIFRIDNGFMLCINMNSEAHLGARGSLVYAKDAEELAQKIVAHEAAFKMGIHGRSEGSAKNGHVGIAPNYVPTNRI